MRSIRFLTFALAFAFFGNLTFAQEAVEDRPTQEKAETPEKRIKKPARSVQELMTPDEFKAAGLDKLNEDEMQHLDAWLQGYRQTTERKASELAERKANEEVKQANEKADKAEKATAEVKAKQPRLMVDHVVTRIDGNFPGLKGHTVIPLEDGTVWKQANKDDNYTSVVADHPMVTVSKGPFGYKMRVEGMPEFYVNPVRSKQ
jgi:hypothetical protein